jgi:hypothetical protein
MAVRGARCPQIDGSLSVFVLVGTAVGVRFFRRA